MAGGAAARWLWTLVALQVSLSTTASAGVQARIEVGAETDGSTAPEPRFEARLQYDTKRYKGIEAVFDVGADAQSRRIELYDAFADYRSPNGSWRAQIGRGKKVLGWEYEDSRIDRLAIERSLAYRFLQSSAMVGRDYFVSARHGRLESSVHYDASGQLGTIFAWRARPAEGLEWGTWALLQKDVRSHLGTVTWGAVTGLKGTRQRHRWTAELLGGNDRFQTERELAYGSGARVHFLALKAEYGVRLGAVLPYVQAVALVPDLRTFGRNTLQGLVGVRYGFLDHVVLAGELEGTAHDPAPMGTIWDSPLLRVQLIVYVP